MAYVNNGGYEKWLKQQQAAALNNAYNEQKAQTDNKYNGGLGGFLGNIVGSIGQGISNVWNAGVDMIGSGIASARDLGSIIATGKSAGEEEKWLKYRRGTDDIRDARLKTAGQALNAATDLATTALPGLGAGSKAAKALGGTVANTAAGAIGGVADEFQQQGKDARLDSLANRAISGAAAGLTTGKLGDKIGNAKSTLGKTLLNNKFATSTIGRGALSGAVGGGVGAGTSAALGGGDVLGATLEGAKSGAISGGVQAGITTAAKSIAGAAGGKRTQNRWEKQQDRNFENAIKNPSSVKENVYLGELSDKNYNDVANVLNKVGLTTADGDAAITIKNNAMYLTPEGAQHLYERRIIGNNMSAEDLRATMRNATKNGTVLPEPSYFGNATIGAMNGKKADIAHIGAMNGNLELASTYPARSGQMRNKISSASGGAVPPSTSLDVQSGLPARPNSALQSGAITDSIAQDKQNVNGNAAYTQMFRGQGTGTDDFYLNNNGRISNTVGDGYYLSTDRGVSEAFAQDGGGIISPNIDNTKIASKQEVENIIKQATDTVNDSKRYEALYNSNPELAELYDNVALGRYDAIAKALGKPVVPTIETDSNGEYLYYKGVDNDYDTVLKSQLQTQGLSEDQLAFFKNSKIRDENGNLIPMYHGTPDGSFNEFNEGSYFTPNKEYADQYRDQVDGSVLKRDKQANNPRTYEVYINSENPFSLSDQKAKDIYYNEYIRGGNSDNYTDDTPRSMVDTLDEVDWSEGEKFRNWLKENHPEYDSLYLDEGGAGGYGEYGDSEYRHRGYSLVPLGNDQIKSINNANPSKAVGVDYTEPQPVVETPVAYEEPVLPNYTTPIDYQGNELKIRNKNIVEKAGDLLSNAGEAIKNSDVYNSLYSKTANKVTQNDSINKLRQLGFEPSDYEEAAKISTTTNKFVDDIVANSGALVTDNTFADRVLSPDDNIIISDPTYQKKYDTKIKQLLDRIETGNYPGQYKAADLLKESRQFGKWANDLRKRSTNVNGDVVNRDGYELAAAYTDVKYALRDLASQAVDGFGDKYTKSQLTERLKNLGAPQKAIDYMLDADNIGDFIRNTSLFEDARQMAEEIKDTKVRRNATAGNSSNPVTQFFNATGIPQITEAALKPVGRITGSIAKGIGDAVQSIGSRLPEGGQGGLSPINQAILGNFIGRTQGNIASSDMVQNARKAEDYRNLQDLLTAAQEAEAQVGQIEQYDPQATQAQNYLSRIAAGMDNAMAVGDYDSYNKLASLYKTAYSMYNLRNPQEQALTSSEKTKQAKLATAEAALDQLENLYTSAGGAQGNIGGGLSSLLSNIGLNDNLSSYNQTAKTLLNQISAATGTIDKNLLPQATDSAEEAQQKLDELRRLISQTRSSYSDAYGW